MAAKKSKRNNFFSNPLNVEMLTKWFRNSHNVVFLIVVVLILVLYILNRNTCGMKLEQINRLDDQLKVAKSKAMSAGTQLTANKRASRLRQMVMEDSLALSNDKGIIYRIENDQPDK
jgi:hypothetical protein